MVHSLLVLWAALAAQAPDSATRARYATALRALSDSLSAVEAAAAQFRADLVTASRDLVISRASRLTQRCAGALAGTPPVDSLPAARTGLRRDLATLRAALVRCGRDFDAGPWGARVDSLKAWAPYRLARLGEAVQRYRLAAHAFGRRAGIK